MQGQIQIFTVTISHPRIFYHILLKICSPLYMNLFSKDFIVWNYYLFIGIKMTFITAIKLLNLKFLCNFCSILCIIITLENVTFLFKLLSLQANDVNFIFWVCTFLIKSNILELASWSTLEKDFCFFSIHYKNYSKSYIFELTSSLFKQNIF